MRGPQVRFRERCAGAILCTYSTRISESPCRESILRDAGCAGSSGWLDLLIRARLLTRRVHAGKGRLSTTRTSRYSRGGMGGLQNFQGVAAGMNEGADAGGTGPFGEALGAPARPVRPVRPVRPARQIDVPRSGRPQCCRDIGGLGRIERRRGAQAGKACAARLEGRDIALFRPLIRPDLPLTTRARGACTCGRASPRSGSGAATTSRPA